MKKGIPFVVAAFALCANATTPGGVDKKFIALNFDVMFNSPSNVLAHADELNKIPWLDGVAVTLDEVVLKTVDGSVATTSSTRVMHRSNVWTRKSVESQLPHLKGIVARPRLTESFLLAWISPSGKENRIPWSDDAGWKFFSENLGVLAWLAKASGLKGLMLDPEEYSGALQYLYKPEDGVSFSECRKLARQRGREVFSRVFAEFPDAVLFFLWTMEHHVRHFVIGGVTDPQTLSGDYGELLPDFYNGMLDVIPPTARFVDGAEHYSLTATKDMYWKGALNQLVGAKAFVAPENWGRYRAQLLVGNTHYLDMFSIYANPKSHWYHAPVDGSRLNHLRLNIEQSLQSADEYVWIYGENGRLIDWKCAPTKRQGDKVRLWEDQIPGMSETFMLAKDPDALLAEKKRACAAKGGGTNLVEGVCSMPAVFSYSAKAQHMVVKQPPSVKDVARGEIYRVRQRLRHSMREGTPSVKVVWRKKGKPVAENAAVVLAVDASKPKTGQWAEGEVTVPADVDELVVETSADLLPGESASANLTEVFKVGDAPDAPEPSEDDACSLKATPRPVAGKRRRPVNLLPKKRPAGEVKAPKQIAASLSPQPCVKGVVPGELYGVGASMKSMNWVGIPHFRVKWRGEGKLLPRETERTFSLKGEREHGVWRRAETIVRVPQGADELVVDIGAIVMPGESFEFDKVEVIKLGDPTPKWPEEAERPKM